MSGSGPAGPGLVWSNYQNTATKQDRNNQNTATKQDVNEMQARRCKLMQ